MSKPKRAVSLRIPPPTTFNAPVCEGGPTPIVRGANVRGRVNYSPEIARYICHEIMKTRSLKSVCTDSGTPSRDTVIGWLACPDKADFREMYYYARRIAAEIHVDDIFEIANDTSNDWQEVKDAKGLVIDHKPNNEALQRSKLKIDTIKWYAAKMIPRIYGDKLDVELDATGDLAELLKSASNRSSGLPEAAGE